MPTVPRRRFGRTELAMPMLTCGGMRFQKSWDDVDWKEIDTDNQANLEATLARALALGINHFETARGYGSSERQLGRVLPRWPRESFLLQTKIAPQEEGAVFRQLFEVSLQRLGVEYVDLLSLHGINNRALLETSLRAGGSLEVARALQREGRVRFIGFSTHAPCPVIIQALQTGEFDYVNLHWYWIFQENWPAILEARRQDAGVFIISPNDKGGKLYAPSERLCQLCAPLHPMAFNDLFCLARPEVHTLSLGVSRPEDFTVHVEALTQAEALTPQALQVAERLDAHMAQTLGEVWWRHGLEGLPEWDEVPGEINLRMLVRLWNLDEALDLRDYARMRYNLLGQGGHWFPGRNAEHYDEKALRRCLADYPFVEHLLRIVREAHARWGDQPVQRLSSA